jgi:hypothetical protein
VCCPPLCLLANPHAPSCTFPPTLLPSYPPTLLPIGRTDTSAEADFSNNFFTGILPASHSGQFVTDNNCLDTSFSLREECGTLLNWCPATGNWIAVAQSKGACGGGVGGWGWLVLSAFDGGLFNTVGHVERFLWCLFLKPRPGQVAHTSMLPGGGPVLLLLPSLP